MFSTCLSFSPHVILRAVLGKRAPDRKETPRKDSWLSNGHFRPPAAQINLIYGEISRLRFFTMESVQCQSFLGKNRLKVISLGAELQWNCVNNFALLLDFDRTPARQFNGHFSIPQCAGGESIESKRNVLLWEGNGRSRSHIFRPVNLQESNIYSGPGIRRHSPIIGKEQRKGGQKNKVFWKRTTWKQLTVFPKEKAIFSFRFPFPPRPLMGKRYKI